MGKVRMRNVHNGVVYTFDSGPNNAELRKAIQSGDWTQELNPAQQLVKGVSDWAPAIGSGVGAAIGAAGGVGAAGVPTLGVGAIPGGIAGGVAGGLQGGLLGASLRELGYSAAGVQKDDSPMAMAGRFGLEGANGMLAGMGQAVGAAPRPGAASSLMKGAVGNAQPEIEQEMIQRGIPASSAGRRMVAKAINDAKAQKREILDWASGPEGLRVSWKHIRETLAGAAKRLSEADPIGLEGDNAMARALAIARHKAGVFRQQAIRAGEAVPPGEDAAMTPVQIERIRKFADAKYKYYEKMRMGQVVPGEPSPMEGAYKAIADRLRGVLNNMRHPTTNQSLGEVNDEIGKLADIGKTIAQVQKRSTGRNLLSAGLGAATAVGAAGTATHDPMRALLFTAPGAAVGYATSSPDLLSRTAIAMSKPSAVRGAFGQALPQALGALERMGGWSDPSLKPKPEGSQ